MVQIERYGLLTAEHYYQEKFLDIVTRKKINKHVTDITDTITEQDIKNVKTDFGTSVSGNITSSVIHSRIISKQ